LKYCAHPLVCPSLAAAISPVVGIVEALADHAKAAPVTAVGAGVAVIITPPFGATLVLWTCDAAVVQKPGATMVPQVAPVVTDDQALGLAAAFVAWTSTSIAVAPVRPVIAYGLATFETVVQVPAPEGLKRRLNPVAAPWVLSIAGAAQVMVSLVFVPSGGAATLEIAGAFGAYGPATAVVIVRMADQALVPVVFELWT
jgi:hypothetical protein